MSHSLAIRHQHDPHADTSLPDPHQDVYSKNTLGFWIYLMTDCLLFGTFFATYAVMHGATYGGPSSKELFSLTTAFVETMILLMSSVTCGLAVLATYNGSKNAVLAWMGVTFLLGAAFVGIELDEFRTLIHEGAGYDRSGFLAAFFALVGTHGLHVSFGLLWLAVMAGQLMAKGVTTTTFRRLVMFSMFWHFLDLIWIFIFTFVYLMGVL